MLSEFPRAALTHDRGKLSEEESPIAHPHTDLFKLFVFFLPRNLFSKLILRKIEKELRRIENDLGANLASPFSHLFSIFLKIDFEKK